jgi:hypothetical protein
VAANHVSMDLTHESFGKVNVLAASGPISKINMSKIQQNAPGIGLGLRESVREAPGASTGI